MNILLNISFDFDFWPLLVVAGIAWLVPFSMSLMRMEKVPSVIVEIIIGYLIGSYLLRFASVESIKILEFLALIGFIFLMFLSGLEIDVDQIKASFPRRRLTLSRFLKNPLLVGLVFFAVTLFLSILGAWILSNIVNISSVWYFSLIMITTSVGVIFPVLKSRGETIGHFGQMMILAAAVADIFSILLFTFTAYIIKNGFRPEIFLIIGLFLIFYLFYFLGRKLRHMFFRKITFQLAHAASQISIRGTLLIMLVFVVLAQLLGTEVVLLGAFLSGLLLSFFLQKERSLLMIKLDGMGFGFFIPVFFIMVGAKFSPASLAEFDNSLVIFLVLLLITLYAVKVLPSLMWARLFGTRRAIAGGFLMASRLSLIIAATSIGLELNVITPGVNASFIMMAVITCLVSPIIFNTMNPSNIFVGDKTIIVGGSSTGVLLARRLKMHGHQAVIVEQDKERYKDIVSKGLSVLSADGTQPETYQKLKLVPGNYVVVDTGSHDINIKVCELLRKEFQHENIISRSVNIEIDILYRRLNIELLDVTRVLATTIENLIIRPSTYHALVDTFEDFLVEDILIIKGSIDGRFVKEIPFHKDCMLILVRRGEDLYIPHGETILRTGDTLTVFGTGSALEDTRKQLG